MPRTVPFYLLAALCFTSAFLPGPSQAQALQPYQQQALDTMLATAEADTRAVMREQLTPILAAMGPAQVEMMLAAFLASENSSAAEQPEEDSYSEDTVATPEDLAFNRAQYEPVIRSLWQAQKAFDDYADARLEAGCAGEFAVYGSGWRYELYPLNPYWQRASNSPDLDVEIVGGSYAPQDGRYRFDFSKVKTAFDQAAVGAAIDRACGEYTALGQAFVSSARRQMSTDGLPDGQNREGQVNAQAAPIRERLQRDLELHAPAANGALFMALLEGERVN